MIFALYFASGFVAMGCIWLFVETQRLRRQIKARLASPTKHRRKRRDSPERNQVGEVSEGVERTGGIDYKWLGITGSEQE